MAWMSADEAMKRLNIRQQTLYAYVSRGRLEARPDPADPRRSLYSAEDISNLAARRARPRKAADVAKDAIAWGEPVMASALTTVTRGRLYYRGRDAIRLSESMTLEEAAAFFWDAPYTAPRTLIALSAGSLKARLFAAIGKRDVLLHHGRHFLLGLEQVLHGHLDLRVGHCRIAVAEPADMVGRDDPRTWSHVRVATKYPRITRRHFAARGVQAECIKLNGAVELAPALGLCRRIVDLVSSGATLKANGLVEIEHIADITSRLVVNRAALKTRRSRGGTEGRHQ